MRRGARCPTVRPSRWLGLDEPYERHGRRGGRLRVRLSAGPDGPDAALDDRGGRARPGADAGTPERVRARTRAAEARPPGAARPVRGHAAQLGLARSRTGAGRADVPETHGRFYVFSLVDLWTNVFASRRGAHDRLRRRHVRDRRPRRCGGAPSRRTRCRSSRRRAMAGSRGRRRSTATGTARPRSRYRTRLPAERRCRARRTVDDGAGRDG